MLVKGSFEDYIYILVGIIWIAYSIYKGTQKNKQKSKPVEARQTGTKESKSAFESFLDEILVEEQPLGFESAESTLRDYEPVTSEQEEQKEPFSYDDIYEESNFEEDLGVYSLSAVSNLREAEKQKTKPTTKKRKPYIDLRKAVVYSEILNRRYF